MKKLLVLAVSALLVLGLATASFAAATFSGEIDVKAIGATPTTGDGLYQGSLFSKMVLSGKLGDDLTGTLVYKTDPMSDAGAAFAVDEASLTFTEDWGVFKTGYFGWNNNIKDILDTYTDDVKTDAVVNVKFNITDNVNLGIAYGYSGNTFFNDTYKNPYGADLGFVTDTFGADLLYFNYGKYLLSGTEYDDTAWGINAYVKLADFKPFIQYRNETWGGDSYVNSIIGATYEPANAPIYARGEVELDTTYYTSNPWGIRFGYKLEDGAKVEAQYFAKGHSNSEYYVKVIAAF